MIEQAAFINRLYQGFNARDLDGVLAMLAPDVVWANGMEGGYVQGREGVRAYWTRQWAGIDPRVDPESISVQPSGTVLVTAHQVVRDLNGKTLSDEMVSHIFTLSQGLVVRFDIGNPTSRQ